MLEDLTTDGVLTDGDDGDDRVGAFFAEKVGDVLGSFMMMVDHYTKPLLVNGLGGAPPRGAECDGLLNGSEGGISRAQAGGGELLLQFSQGDTKLSAVGDGREPAAGESGVDIVDGELDGSFDVAKASRIPVGGQTSGLGLVDDFAPATVDLIEPPNLGGAEYDGWNSNVHAAEG